MFKLNILSLIIIVINFKTNVRSVLIPSIRLSDGNRMPSIGFGTYPLKNCGQTLDILMKAIDIGYRMFDTAFQYDNELIVGQAIRQAIASGVYDRNDFFVVTKIWNTFHSRELVHKQTQMSLKNLGLDYVDLLLMHYPTGYLYPGDAQHKLWFPKYPNETTIPSSWRKNDFIDTYKGMEDMVRNGWTKSIGISNFNVQQMKFLLDNCEIKPVVNQFECNPFYKQLRLVNYCHQVGVVPNAYSTVHHGVFHEPNISRIAIKYSKTVTQVSIRWLLERGIVAVVKSKNHMIDNIDVFDFNLSKEEVNQILQLEDRPKKIDDKGAHTHPDYPFFEPRVR